jgi:hypothetical protein
LADSVVWNWWVSHPPSSCINACIDRM